MKNKYNTYDVVRINKSFIIKLNDNEVLYPTNTEGTIMECFDKEYLIEVENANSDVDYALIEEDYLELVWKAD